MDMGGFSSGVFMDGWSFHDGFMMAYCRQNCGGAETGTAQGSLQNLDHGGGCVSAVSENVMIKTLKHHGWNHWDVLIYSD